MYKMEGIYKIPKLMKALIKRSEVESFEYTDIPVPEPEGDEVLIKVEANSICGSDIALYRWNDVGREIAKVPFIPGHETAGTVVKCGPDATLKVGTVVGVENHFFCGECYHCKHDLRQNCTNMGQYGHGRKTMHGGCAEYSIVSSKYLYAITKGLTAEEIALLEPLGVAHNGVEQLKVKDEDVLVIGCGPMGLLVQMLAKVMGAKRVIAADVEPRKLDLAKELGADMVVNTKETDIKEFILELTAGTGIGRICECSGASQMVNTCFSYLRKGNGRTVMIGLPKQPLHVENVLQDIVFKCLTLKTIHGRRFYRTWVEIEQLVAEKKVDVTKIITHRFPMSQFEEAFKILFDGSGCKIILDPTK